MNNSSLEEIIKSSNIPDLSLISENSQFLMFCIALIGILLTLKTIKEMQIQRQSSYQPHFRINSTPFSLIISTKDNKILCNNSHIDKKDLTYEDPYVTSQYNHLLGRFSNNGEFTEINLGINLLNIGLGPATDITIKFIYDYFAMFRIIQGHEQFKNFFSIISNPLLSDILICKGKNYSIPINPEIVIPYINVSKERGDLLILIPQAFMTLLSYQDYIKFIIQNDSSLVFFPNDIELIIEYYDIGSRFQRIVYPIEINTLSFYQFNNEFTVINYDLNVGRPNLNFFFFSWKLKRKYNQILRKYKKNQMLKRYLHKTIMQKRIFMK